MDVWIISYKKRPATRMKLPKFRFSNRGENVANYLSHAGRFCKGRTTADTLSLESHPL
jgi:hypothetical protein